MKFQRRFANNFSFLNSYTYGKAIDLNSDNDGLVTLTNVYDPQYNRGPADYDITHTFSSSWIYELPWAQREARTAAGRSAGILTLRGGLPLTVTPDPGRAVDRDRQPSEPDLRRQHLATRPSIEWFDTALLRAADRQHRHLRRCRPRHHPRTGLVQHRRLADQEHARSAASTTEFRVEAFNLLNHPQFGNPNTTLGNAAFGTISAMLSSPSCSLCGTVERQVQLGRQGAVLSHGSHG